MQRLTFVVLIVFACLLLSGCEAGDPQFSAENPAGFLFGLWHGLIAFIALVVGIFNDSVEIYERANSGGWYDFGFLIGVAIFSGSGHQSHHRWRNGRRRRSD